MSLTVLGIESSCDETGVAIYHREGGLLAERLYSQVDLHATYGGVVPELAARDHQRRLPQLIAEALAEAQLEPRELDAVAYTAGPGLVGALLAGASAAAGLALAWDKPLLAVHHMEAHLLAPYMGRAEPPPFPFVALLVSGGHTLLVHCQAEGDYTLLGQTLDDAVGEAFDKCASLLGLPYPGGAALAKLAAQAEQGIPGLSLPRPMTKARSLDFSFSGLKTAFALAFAKHDDGSETTRAALARSFEEAVVETMVRKCVWALQEVQCQRLIIGGGVAANQRLRAALQQALEPMRAILDCPPLKLCTDNGAMIAHLASRRGRVLQVAPATVPVRARWPLDTLKG